MCINLPKCCKVATVSAVILACLGIFGPLLAASLPSSQHFISPWIGLGLFATFISVLVWSGFKAVNQGLDRTHGTVVGGVSGLAGSIVSGSVNLALPASAITMTSVFVTVFGIVFWMLAGLALGTAGGYLASKGSGQKQSQPRKSAPKRR